jgi:hypothetical protein
VVEIDEGHRGARGRPNLCFLFAIHSIFVRPPVSVITIPKKISNRLRIVPVSPLKLIGIESATTSMP